MMSGLVGYGSSDEEDDIQPDKPSKVSGLICFYASKYGYLLIFNAVPDSKSRTQLKYGDQRYLRR
jgi:hypothetical protein